MNVAEMNRRYELWHQGYWVIPDGIDVSNFNFDWRPEPYDRPYVHQFGTQWQRTGGPKFVVPENEGIKFRNEQIAIKLPDRDKFKILIDEKVDFDWSWHPDELEPPFIWVFGNQFFGAHIMPTIEYIVENATDKKYVCDPVAKLVNNKNFWKVFLSVDKANFDFSWMPPPYSPPQIYQWEDNGPIYTVPGASDVVFMKRTQNYSIDPIPRYFIKTTLIDLIEQHEDEVFWALNPDLNYDKFDFSWKPDEYNFRHVNVFGNELSKDTQTYYINGPLYKLGNKEINYVENTNIKISSNLSMFWIDTGTSDNIDRFVALQKRYPEIQKTRYINSWVETINRCIKKSKSKLLWVLSSEVDYSNFEFDFYPSTWQMKMTHVLGTQWSHWGNTYLINSESFLEDSKYIKVIEHLPRINHVRGKRTKITGCKYDILYIDHGYDSTSTLEYLKSLGKHVYQTSYDKSYLTTIKNWINGLSFIPDDYKIWITSSICSYNNFDFSWHPDPFQVDQLHVFSSEYNGTRQKFGDTFLLNISEFKQHIDETFDLQKYENKVNYIQHLSAPRLTHPVITHSYDSQIDAVKSIKEISWPYYELIDQNNCINKSNSPVINLWEESRNSIIVAATGASHIMTPSSAIEKIKNEIYDYPWIDVSSNLKKSKPLDIVFISNGEPIAESNYEHLLEITKKLKITNRIVRVKDVKGRIASQHAAANASSTNWYFLVNGKIKINESFDWNWQPDRLQQPKHYIFKVTNPVNGLEYGHQAIVANNKTLTLNTEVKGLDFTLDSLHDVIDMNCGVALYNTDPWTTWRTSFRESVKLSCNEDDVSKDRLSKWLTVGVGEHEEWSRLGAKDGVDYYNQCNENLNKLMLTYDWDWLYKFYSEKYKK